MKRVAFILVVIVAGIVATRMIVERVSENISGVRFRMEEVQPAAPQTVVTSLPPLTNLTIKPQRQIAAKAEVEEVTLNTNPPVPTAAPAKKKSGKPPRQDLLARVALASVGIDPVAEEYWVMAINDPSLGEHEREDLIEDLNEEGFADPKNPTIEELPIIINRLQIIEDYAPFAMDDVNARSFAEAYKDLLNTYVRLTGNAFKDQ
jgi:hypothetical protein